MRRRPGLAAILVAMLLSVPAGAAAQTGEARVQHWTNAYTTTCRAHGGRASIQPDYQTRADLNGDGAPDFILDARRVACLGALDALCPSNLCPLMVLLSGPLGDRPSLDVMANGWSLDITDSPPSIVVRQPGPRRFQWDGRTMAEVVPGAARPPPMAAPPPDAPPKDDPPPAAAPPPPPPQTFVQPTPRPLPGPASQVAPGAASQVAPRPMAPTGPPDIAAAPRPILSGNWEIRPIANRAPLAMSPGPGAIESIALLCNEGVPVAAFTLQGRLPSGPPSVTFAFQAGRVETGIAQPAGATNRIFYADLRGSPIPRLLAWEGGSVRLLLSGTIQGNLSLEGAGRAVRAALEDCYRF
jgi:hypothetical protein